MASPNNLNIDTFIKESTDITNFLINGKETLICSDFEGTLPTKQIENFQSVFSEKSKQIVYLGDIFDNTGCDKGITRDNYCSLKTLKYLVDYPEKSRYVVGNRDINKIKLVPLLQFTDNSKWWLSESEKPDLNVNSFNENIYIDIVSKLINNNLKSWKVKTMTDYVPFWAKKPDELKKKWLGLEAPFTKEMTTLYERFVRIFGTDTTEGTMSADKILNGLPDELFDTIKKIINNIRENIISNIELLKTNIKNSIVFNENMKKINEKNVKDNKPVMTDDEITNLLNKFIDFEIRSAIVFTVFMRMLDKDLYKPKTMPISFSLNKIGDLDGYLWKYLTTASPALYAKQNNDLLLFSHGGITNEFLNNNSFDDTLNKIDSDGWRTVLDSKTEKNPGKFEITNQLNETQIKQKISDYNKQYFDILTNCFDNFSNLTKTDINTQLMILLSISSPAENNIKLYEKGYKTSSFSPIQPKQPKESQLIPINESIKIYSFWGHAAICFGYGFKKVSKNMFYICTDFSTSLFKKEICGKKYNENNLNLTITYKENEFNLNLTGIISISDKFIKNTGKPNPKAKDKALIPIVTSNDDAINDINVILENQQDEYQVVVIDKKMKTFDTNETMDLNVNYQGKLDSSFFKEETTGTSLNNVYKTNYIYNGKIKYKGIEYELYSYYDFDARKGILILSPSLNSPPLNSPPLNSPLTATSSNTPPTNGGNRKKLNKYKSIKKNRKYKTKGKLFKKNSTRNRKMKSNKKH